MSDAVDLAAFDPIFIVGSPRSGTTLLRAIFNRHPRIGLSDETYFFYSIYRRRQSFGDLALEMNRRALVESYAATHRMGKLEVDLAALKTRLMAQGTSYPAFFATILQFCAEAHGKVRAGEKTPHHAMYVDKLLEWFPNAKVIHLVRDPRGVCASLFNVPWGRRSAAANAELWVDLTAAAERANGDPRFRRVRYEDLVADPEPTLRELCEFVGEEYEPAMLSDAPVATADQPWFERARSTVSGDRAELWHRQLSPADVSLIEAVAGPLMKSLGYELRGTPASGALRLRGRLHSTVEDAKLKFLRAPRLWYSWFQPRNLAGLEKWTDR